MWYFWDLRTRCCMTYFSYTVFSTVVKKGAGILSNDAGQLKRIVTRGFSQYFKSLNLVDGDGTIGHVRYRRWLRWITSSPLFLAYPVWTGSQREFDQCLSLKQELKITKAIFGSTSDSAHLIRPFGPQPFFHGASTVSVCLPSLLE